MTLRKKLIIFVVTSALQFAITCVSMGICTWAIMAQARIALESNGDVLSIGPCQNLNIWYFPIAPLFVKADVWRIGPQHPVIFFLGLIGNALFWGLLITLLVVAINSYLKSKKQT